MSEPSGASSSALEPPDFGVNTSDEPMPLIFIIAMASALVVFIFVDQLYFCAHCG